MADKTSSIVWSPSASGWNGRHRMGIVSLSTGDIFDIIPSTGEAWSLEFIAAPQDLSIEHREVASPNLTSEWSSSGDDLLIDGPDYIPLTFVPMTKEIPVRVTNQYAGTNVVVFSVEKLS